MNALNKSKYHGEIDQVPVEHREFLTFTVNSQVFGIPVLAVRDVLNARHLTRIPLSRSEVAGALNLRGRIITAIDMRERLLMAKSGSPDRHMNIVVNHIDEHYSLIADSVGDVLALPMNKMDPNPANMNSSWKEFSAGVFRLPGGLLIILDVPKLLAFVG